MKTEEIETRVFHRLSTRRKINYFVAVNLLIFLRFQMINLKKSIDLTVLNISSASLGLKLRAEKYKRQLK